MTKRLDQQRLRIFRFLDRLRARGRSNMYGAVPYLMREFALDRGASFSLVCEWLDLQEAEPDAAARAGAVGRLAKPVVVGRVRAEHHARKGDGRRVTRKRSRSRAA